MLHPAPSQTDLTRRQNTEEVAPLEQIHAQLDALEHNLMELYEHVPFGCHSVGPDGTYRHINTRELHWLGTTREAVIGLKKPSDFLTPASQDKFARWMAERGAFGFEALELEIQGHHGAPRPIAMSFNGLRSPNGGEHTSRTVCFDLTDNRRKAENLRMAALAFESLCGICITDGAGRILRVNQAFTSLTGYTASEACGQTMRLLHSGLQDSRFYQQMWSTLLAHRSWQGDIRNRCKDGRVMAVWLNIAAVPDATDHVSHYVGTFYDITAHKAAEEAVTRLAYFDPLTQLPNRRLLQDRLAQAVAAVPRSGVGGALLFVDLDHFKTINDTRGHDAGDLLLKEVSRRLQACVRHTDSVARLGGDEFVVLLGELDGNGVTASQQAERVAHKLLAALSEPYAFEGFDFVCSASVGISLFGADSQATDLLQHADLAMYQAKKYGGNALCFFDPLMQATLNARSALEQALRLALPRSEYRLVYQPQVDAQGRVLAAEALLRWRPAGQADVGPATFIPVAEEAGLILSIGLWVLDTALAHLRAWQDNSAMRHLQVAVNVSACQFDQPEFVAQVTHRLHRSGADPTRLKLEITESMVLNVEQAIEKMNALRALGVRFSMDDFGTGHSSLSSLSRLPLDQLKIDQSFVSRMGTHPTDAVIVRTTIAMANTLGLHVIAEGVETAVQRQFLQDNGCTCYQGYLCGRPMERDAFEALFAPPPNPALRAGADAPG